jgi:hypothetical protein
MAIYDNLPVFKASYDLLLEIYRLSENLKRDYRYTLGENLKQETMAMMVNIYKANSVEDKTALLGETREKLVAVKLYIRLLHDLKQLSVKQFALLSVQTESISKQLAAWHKSGIKIETRIIRK